MLVVGARGLRRDLATRELEPAYRRSDAWVPAAVRSVNRNRSEEAVSFQQSAKQKKHTREPLAELLTADRFLASKTSSRLAGTVSLSPPVRCHPVPGCKSNW